MVACGIDVALHFAERDRRLGQRTVLVEDRIVRVLPPLLDQTAVRRARVLHEAVAVAIAVAIDPGQSGLDVRPELLDRREIAGPVVVAARQQHEQGRGVHAAVVGAKRHFAECRHFAASHLVQNLAGLRVACRVVARGLCRREG